METKNTSKKQDLEENIDKAFLESKDEPIPKTLRSPKKLFLIIVISIFISEAIVMFILGMIPPLALSKAALFDAILLVVILLPLLYLLIYKPLKLYVVKLKVMEKKLNEEVITDDLTGLFNRRGFFTLAKKQCEIASRNKLNLYFLFIDLDNMKSINDKYGHKEGDQALLNISNILRASFRSSDIISRIGGDEFTIIVMETPETNLEILSKRLNGNLKNINLRSEKFYKLSLSSGLAEYKHETPCSIDDLIAKADKLMYAEKREKKQQKKS